MTAHQLTILLTVLFCVCALSKKVSTQILESSKTDEKGKHFFKVCLRNQIQATQWGYDAIVEEKLLLF